MMAGSNPIILYDGVCGLCNRLIQFLLKHDKEGRLRFASLQSEFAEKVLGRHGCDPKDLDTVHVVENYDQADERVLQRSDAILRAGRELGGFWGAASSVAKVVPRGLRDVVYRLVATNRYRVFGKYDSCMLPDPKQRSRFLDI
ncbi:MAG TPA: thiol-disulfide oxidoreductase DCC family protein [Pyrinomonadaceae bacterium]|nr:thiol-disulfide oxidoreductase DCC family protein [Pyrinomonadaceae bacterium]